MKDTVKNPTPLTLKQVGDLGPKTMRTKPFEKRERKKGEALPPAANLFTRGTYVTGDGEVLQLNRPGSSDFLKWPSKGIGA